MMLQPVLDNDKKRQCQLGLGSTSECGAAASSTDFFEELFVLEGHRSLIRISAKPDKYNVMRLTHDAADMNPLGTEETEGVGIETVGSNLAFVGHSVASKLQGLSSIGERLGIFAPSEENPSRDEADFVAKDAVEATEAGNDALRLDDVIGGPFGGDDGNCIVEARKSPKKRPVNTEDDHRLEDCDDVQGDEVCSGLRLELDLNSPEEETEEEMEERLMKQLRIGEYRSGGVSEEMRREESTVSEHNQSNPSTTPPPTQDKECQISTNGEEILRNRSLLGTA